MLLFGGGIATGVALTSVFGRAVSVATKAVQDDQLATAQLQCDASHTGTELGDNGKTLTINGAGTEDMSGADTATIACILQALSAPDAVTTHMSETRALDGRQEDSWSGYSASWIYHPDDGLDVIIRRV
ncbi:hypothetical protein [Krasilnikovia sp. MM14-A1259]|uniref:hypothetical protein n=1 Tax=Krasilnikovia sp. MM14-A1259 TaxID=3373539 RepID=UPI00381585B5